MNDEVKVWWQSKTIWAQLIGVAFALASIFGLDLADKLGMSEAEFLALVMTLVGLATTFMRFGSPATVVPTKAEVTKIQSLVSTTRRRR